MFNTSRSHKWIAPALVALAVGIYAWRFLPILNDDPYITARYARNLATGHGFVYNEGERVLGTTTPLTTLLLAGGMIALPDELALRLLSALFLGLTSALFLVFGRCFGRPLAGLAAGLLFPTIDWVARNHGGEFPLCVLLGLACATLVQRRHMALAGVCAGLLALTRGEGLLFGGLLGLWATCRGRQPDAPRLDMVAALRFGGAMLALVAPWYLFSRLYFGDWFPRTLAMKRLQGAVIQEGLSPWPTYLSGAFDFFRQVWLNPAGVVGLLAWLGLPGLVRREGRILVVWALVHTSAYALLRVPGNYGWYHYPLFAVTAWSAGCGLQMWIALLNRNRWCAHSPRGRAMVATACVLLGVLLSARATVGRALHPDPHDYFLSRYTRYHTLGNYLAQHACADETVQLEEIGVMGFYGWPVRVRDTNSLIHRDIAPERIGHSGRIAQAHPHDMIVTYNSHGRYFVAHRDGRPCVYERLFESSHTPPNPTLYRRLDQPPENWDFGLFPGEDWGGVIVHWTRTRADVPFVAEGERLRIRYHIGHPDISPTHPVRVTFSVNDAKPRTLTHEATGYFDETIPLADIDATTTATLRLEVNRTWLSQEGRLLGIALFPLICEFEK